MDSHTTIDDLIDFNLRSPSAAPGVSAPPSRRLAIVSCMDARIDVHRVLGLEPGEAHVIRNAGGVVTDDVLRSLVISQRRLGTEEIMLMQHTDCGMLTFTDEELNQAIEADVGAAPEFSLGTFADLEKSVRASVQVIRECPFIPHREHVRGFVYEVETGKLREVA